MQQLPWSLHRESTLRLCYQQYQIESINLPRNPKSHRNVGKIFGIEEKKRDRTFSNSNPETCTRENRKREVANTLLRLPDFRFVEIQYTLTAKSSNQELPGKSRCFMCIKIQIITLWTQPCDQIKNESLEHMPYIGNRTLD